MPSSDFTRYAVASRTQCLHWITPRFDDHSYSFSTFTLIRQFGQECDGFLPVPRERK